MLTAPQESEAGRLLRRLPKGVWAELARAERIAVREASKAFSDMVMRGTGFVRQGHFGPHQRDGSDIATHVPWQNVWKETA